ncbi:nucleotide exchange factor GrpE [Buchnera aphidicola (Takecallis taiwana)]|uniref:nucleotide exchange factor GrpE n=1 Tax=Buchnera aphidicola TaxID=9 RepID=UPI0031B6C378
MIKKTDYLKNLILDENKDILFIKKISKKNVHILLSRMNKDVNNVHKYSLSNIIIDILSDIDNLEKSLMLSSQDKTLDLLTEELKNILKLFDNFFIKYHITIINDIHVEFNPDIHQAIAISDVHDIKPNYVIQVMQKGYKLHERVLRPAMVVVSK